GSAGSGNATCRARASPIQGWSSHDRRSDKPRYASLVYRQSASSMMRSPTGRYPFSRFMASPSRAKRSELEHDSFASTLPGSIGSEVVGANVDGPDPDSGTS